jgi:hypothetical protein
MAGAPTARVTALHGKRASRNESQSLPGLASCSSLAGVHARALTGPHQGESGSEA